MFLFVRVKASSRWRIYTRYVRSVRQQASARGGGGGGGGELGRVECSGLE